MARLSEADHSKVSSAIAAAESGSDGEIVAVATDLSDPYHDVALHWAVLALIATLAIFAAAPSVLQNWFEMIFGGWRSEPTLGELLTLLLVLAVLKFTAVLLALKYMPLRLALTPGATKQRRVRRRAIAIFKAGAERRTIGRTGILIYLSMGEHRAEIIGDEAITKVTAPETWGEAMAALLVEVKAGRAADGIVAAVERVGDVLKEHFPRSSADTNEIPDKLIEL
ncbi:MAG: TPM domain-containing protein [Sphingomicrobium sp.]